MKYSQGALGAAVTDGIEPAIVELPLPATVALADGSEADDVPGKPEDELPKELELSIEPPVAFALGGKEPSVEVAFGLAALATPVLQAPVVPFPDVPPMGKAVLFPPEKGPEGTVEFPPPGNPEKVAAELSAVVVGSAVELSDEPSLEVAVGMLSVELSGEPPAVAGMAVELSDEPSVAVAVGNAAELNEPSVAVGMAVELSLEEPPVEKAVELPLASVGMAVALALGSVPVGNADAVAFVPVGKGEDAPSVPVGNADAVALAPEAGSVAVAFADGSDGIAVELEPPTGAPVGEANPACVALALAADAAAWVISDNIEEAGATTVKCGKYSLDGSSGVRLTTRR